LVVPRIAPRLGAGAPGAPAAAGWLFSAVFVLAAEEPWFADPVVEDDEEDEDVLELLVAGDELDELDEEPPAFPTSDLPPP
jgi:hypothetical protein